MNAYLMNQALINKLQVGTNVLLIRPGDEELCANCHKERQKESHIYSNKNKNFFHDAKTTTAAAMFQYEFNVTFSLIYLWKAQQK